MHSWYLLYLFGPHEIMYYDFSVVVHQSMVLVWLLNTGFGGCKELKSLAINHRPRVLEVGGGSGHVFHTFVQCSQTFANTKTA